MNFVKRAAENGGYFSERKPRDPREEIEKIIETYDDFNVLNSEEKEQFISYYVEFDNLFEEGRFKDAFYNVWSKKISKKEERFVHLFHSLNAAKMYFCIRIEQFEEKGIVQVNPVEE